MPMQPRPRVPRKMKKAVQGWMIKPSGWMRGGKNRRLVLRWIQFQRTANQLGPLPRLPDGRVSIFDLI